MAISEINWDDVEITVGYRTPDLVVSEQLADELAWDAMPEVMEMIRKAYARMLSAVPVWDCRVERAPWMGPLHMLPVGPLLPRTDLKVTDIY